MAEQRWIADKLREWGLNVQEHPGWQSRQVKSRATGRPLSFAPQAVMGHHTAGSAKGDAPSLNVCINGRPGLRGPLCHVVLARSGVCHVIASGHANHAGRGNGWRTISRKYGNSRFLGIEAENTGVSEPWPDVQYRAFVRCAAALLDGIGQDHTMFLGHREWKSTKPDPAGLDLDVMRADIKAVLQGGPQGMAEIGKPVTEREMGYLLEVQRIALALGYTVGSNEVDDNGNEVPDGKYGPSTVRAIQAMKDRVLELEKQDPFGEIRPAVNQLNADLDEIVRAVNPS